MVDLRMTRIRSVSSRWRMQKPTSGAGRSSRGWGADLQLGRPTHSRGRKQKLTSTGSTNAYNRSELTTNKTEQAR